MVIQTHYDNLKVSRDAPDEVIRAAYKSLTQKYHPDRNPGDARAARVTKIINDAYAVLSDPVRRKQHDDWIVREELKAADAQWSDTSHSYKTPTNKSASTWKARLREHIASMQLGQAGLKLVSYGLIAAILGGVVWFSSGKNDAPDRPAAAIPEVYSQAPPPDTSSQGHTTEPSPLPPVAEVQRPVYVRPPLTPRGRPWPSSPGYLAEFRQLHTKGMSEVTIDNSGNGSDVFVKLVALDRTKAYPLRELFVPAHEKFTVNHVAPGSYDVRYRDLDSGQLARTERFSIEQTSTQEGTEFSQVKLTLFKTANGNMHTYELAESDF